MNKMRKVTRGERLGKSTVLVSAEFIFGVRRLVAAFEIETTEAIPVVMIAVKRNTTIDRRIISPPPSD
jgi:hypothetical protein